MRRTVAIVGAGVCGLTCAQQLRRAGIEIVLFDKARGVGGRTSARRIDADSHTTGAPFFETHDPELIKLCKRLCDKDQLEPLRPEHFRSGETIEGFTHWDSPNALCRELMTDLPLATRAHVRGLRRAGERWIVSIARDFPHGFDAAVVTTPGPQARDILIEGKALVAPVSYAPQWAVVVESPLEVPWRFARLDRPALRRVARFRDSWTLYADLEWSRRNYEAEPKEVRSALCSAFEAEFGARARAITDQRWRYSRALTTIEPGWSWSDDLHLGLAGDWRRFGGVEDAFVSGRALGQHIVARLQ